ncbi:MAG: Patatin, partial [Planctomycetota bacterium]
GLAPNTVDVDCGTLDTAVERLDFLWTTFAATTPIEKALNASVGVALGMKEKGVPTPQGDPYSPATKTAMTGLAALGARDVYLGFPALLEALCPDFDRIDWPAVAKTKIRMVAGAIEIKSGNFEAFDSHKTLEEMGLRRGRKDDEQYASTRWRMRRRLSFEGVAASGTLPEALPAQRIPDMPFPTCTPGKTARRDAYYWDGLYSQNPPIRTLLDAESKDEKPDEVWIVRINPQELDREFTNPADIHDRINDLAGNLSLNAELDHVTSLNKWLRKHGGEIPALAEFKPIEVRTIKMRRESAWELHSKTKLDRSRQHVEDLRDEGRSVAQEWLAGWREHGQDFPAYPDDARYD